jgi:hypothetical protein
MSDDGYQGGGTPGGRWGCALAALIGIPLLGLSVLFGALGDCVPDDPCNHYLPMEFILASLAVATVVGLGSRSLINRLIARRRNGS